MGKKKVTPAATEPETITITYDLFDLPTAQHKAGLAGLLLQIQHMEGKKPKPSAIPRIVNRSAVTATIEFTEASLQALFDDAYAAANEPSAPAEKPRKNQRTKAIIPWHSRATMEVKDAKGNKKAIEGYVYLDVIAKLPALEQHLGNRPQWTKLWRNMLWTIPRGNPQSRQPFEQRADGKPCKEGENAWVDLQKVQKAQSINGFHSASVAGSLWLGAQATNAEAIPFEGRAEQNLLLHFWPLTSLVYVPQMVQADGSSEFVGYVLAIPEVTDLGKFLTDYPQLLAGLGNAIRGFRPAEAVIDLPAEGALSFLHHLAALSADKIAGSEFRYSIGSVEFLHLAKFGNNIKTMAAGRVVPRRHLVEEYESITGRPGEKPPFGNPLFRLGLMQALLDDQPWFRPFGKLFCEWPAEFFISSEKSPHKLSWFWADARTKLQQEVESMSTTPSHDDPPPEPNDVLLSLIHRLTRTYLIERAWQKSKLDPKRFKEGEKILWDKVPKEFDEARRAVGESLFLEFRSRRDQAFVEHFAQTFFAVKQYVSEDQYAEIGKSLMARPEDVKTLTLMALSANS